MDPRDHESTEERPAAHRLTDREQALYARTRLETVRDLAEELERFSPRDEETVDLWRDGYAAATRMVVDYRDRVESLAPPPELPPAPCGLEGEIVGCPVLCGYPDGHDGACAHADADEAIRRLALDASPGPASSPPPIAATAPRRRYGLRRVLLAAVVAAVAGAAAALGDDHDPA